MAKIEVPSPPDAPCKSCIRRKNRVNPYKRTEDLARWTGLVLGGLLIIGVVAAYVIMVIWGIQNGQYATNEVEVTEIQNVSVNSWIHGVTILGGTFGGGAVLIAAAVWWGALQEAWEEHSRNWEKRKRIED